VGGRVAEPRADARVRAAALALPVARVRASRRAAALLEHAAIGVGAIGVALALRAFASVRVEFQRVASQSGASVRSTAQRRRRHGAAREIAGVTLHRRWAARLEASGIVQARERAEPHHGVPWLRATERPLELLLALAEAAQDFLLRDVHASTGHDGIAVG